MAGRDHRGLRIAADGRVIQKSDSVWTVVGDTGKRYTVLNFNPDWRCECPNHLRYKHDCKHIKAVKVMLAQEQFGLDFTME